jgi:CO/xanthine dehydrogenase Mo-binding subunit
MFRKPCNAKVWLPFTPRTIWAITGSPVRCWFRRRLWMTSSSTRRHRFRWPKDKVKFAGEPIVMVLAESRYIAEDALADIQMDYEPLEAVVDLEKALEPDSPVIHEEIGSNVAAHVVQTKGDYEAAKR